MDIGQPVSDSCVRDYDAPSDEELPDIDEQADNGVGCGGEPAR